MARIFIISLIYVFAIIPDSNAQVTLSHPDTVSTKTFLIGKKYQSPSKNLENKYWNVQDPGYRRNKEVIVLVIIGVVLLVLLLK